MRARTVVSGMSLMVVVGVTGLLPTSPQQPSPPAPTAQPRSMTMLQLILGDTLRLRLSPDDPNPAKARVARDSARPVAYHLDKADVVTVNESGLVHAVRLGTATITATEGRGAGRTKVIQIRVVTAQRARRETIAAVCPNDDDRFIVSDAMQIMTAVSDIHEYHDCQRLIEGGQYKSLVGIFAHENVASFDKWQDFTDGRLAAVIVNFVGDKGEMPYAPLMLSPGTNCLVIRALSPDQWEAGLKSQTTPVTTPNDGRHYDDCADNLTWADVDPGKVFRAQIQRASDPEGHQIAPPVARWDWDTSNKVNSIGVRCDLTTWCEFGLPTLVPSPARIYKKHVLYKGYYDEQFLADASGTQVSTVLGYILPSTHTENVHGMDHGRKAWYDAAELYFTETAKNISPDFVAYYRHYHTPGANPHSHKFHSLYSIQPKDILWPRSGYDGMLNSKPLLFGGVAFHNHSLHPAKVATVRWHWYEKDEQAWSYCDPEGCCENVATLF